MFGLRNLKATKAEEVYPYFNSVHGYALNCIYVIHFAYTTVLSLSCYIDRYNENLGYNCSGFVTFH